MTRPAFHAWRWAVLFFGNVPNLLLVAWVYAWITRTEVSQGRHAFAWNVGLFAGFALLHSLTATERAKRAFARRFPAAFERGVYVILSGAMLLAVLALWRPLPQVVWAFDGLARIALDGLYFAAFGLAATVGLAFDQGTFIGTRQIARHYAGAPPPRPDFVVRGWFRHTRHPMYFCMIVLVWSAARMTEGRLLFAVLATIYFVVGARFEEARLEREVGEPYRVYRREVPMLVPRLTPYRAPT